MKNNKQLTSSNALKEIGKYITKMKESPKKKKLLNCLITLTMDYGELQMYRGIIEKYMPKKVSNK